MDRRGRGGGEWVGGAGAWTALVIVTGGKEKPSIVAKARVCAIVLPVV